MKAKISITEQNAEIEASQEEVSKFLEKIISNTGSVFSRLDRVRDDKKDRFLTQPNALSSR